MIQQVHTKSRGHINKTSTKASRHKYKVTHNETTNLDRDERKPADN